MEYLKKSFSVSYGSKEYRKNFGNIFGFNPKRDCSEFSKCPKKDNCKERCEAMERKADNGKGW